MMKTFSMLMLLLTPGAGPAAAADEPVRLEVAEDVGIVHLVGHNSTHHPITLSLELTEMHNLAADRVTPLVAVVPAGEAKTLVTLRRADPDIVWRYRYRWSWTPGSPEARHDDDFHYTLPYPRGFSFIARTDPVHPNVRRSHGVTWPLPEATPVNAARGGTVVVVPPAAADPGEETGGLLRILHDDGTLGSYGGLGAVRVANGQRVEAGSPLGFAGPQEQLRFEVSLAVDGVDMESVPVAFGTEESRSTELEHRTTYRRTTEGGGQGHTPEDSAFGELVACRRIDAAGPVGRTDRFLAHEVVHVHMQLAVPDVYALRFEFLRDGESDARAVRHVQTDAEWSGAAVVLDLAGLDDPVGDWEARAFVGREPVGRLEFRVLRAEPKP